MSKTQVMQKVIIVALVLALSVPLFIGGLELRQRLYSRDHCHPTPTTISYDLDDCR